MSAVEVGQLVMKQLCKYLQTMGAKYIIPDYIGPTCVFNCVRVVCVCVNVVYVQLYRR